MSALKKFRVERSATHVRDGVISVRMLPPETNPRPLPNAFTPLEQQVVDLRSYVPAGMILFIMCGYKMKCFGRDARVVARRLGFQCLFADNSPFEHCSFPVQRAVLHCSRLVAMGFHVGIVDQVESAAARAAEGGSSKVFERRLTRALSKASAPDFTSLSIGGGNSGAGPADDDDDGGDDEEGGAAMAATNSMNSALAGPKGASDESNFILFVNESSTFTEMTFVSIGARIIARSYISLPEEKEVSDADVPPQSRYQQDVVAALQSGILCYAPVEIVVKSSVGDGGSLSSLLSSVFNALCKHHSGPSDDEGDVACDVLITMFTDILKNSYTKGMEEMRNVRMMASKGNREAAEVGTPLDTSSVLKGTASAEVLSDTTQAMLGTYFGFFQALDALRAATLTPFLYRKDGSMNLPPTTLQALDVFPSSRNNGSTDSLFSLINRSMTSCGARRLRSWLAAPMCNLHQITERQKAVRELSEEIVDKKLLRAFLQQGQGADIEATMTRLCSARCSYNEYRGFLEKISALRSKAEALVMSYTSAIEEKGVGADASPLIEEVLTAFINDDVEAALAEEALYMKYPREEPLEFVFLKGLKPLPPSMQHEKDVIKAADRALDEELEEARRVLGLPSLSYKVVAQVTNLLEVPTALEKKVPKHWLVVNRIKTATRYRTEEIVHQCAVRTAAEERLVVAAKAHFTEHQHSRYGRPSTYTCTVKQEGCEEKGPLNLYKAFNTFITSVATMDALMSLAYLAQTPGYCLPQLYPQQARSTQEAPSGAPPTLLLRGLAHPMARARYGSGYVSCDVCFDDHTKVWLLTGPNMGGKSALMRSVGLCALLAQVGAHVPAEEARLPIFTSIWCRMGAQDDLLEGSSTFMLEMRETREIIAAHDLSSSLVLMDELGRGTSSYDGVAVADATLSHIISSGCVCMFVTHYHLLTDWHRHDRSLRLKYMSFAEVDKSDEGDAALEHTNHKRIVFLYQPVDGVTPSSFGINVAAMAGLPSEVLRIATEKSSEAERRHSATRALHAVRAVIH